jgi:hypothetical protein
MKDSVVTEALSSSKFEFRSSVVLEVINFTNTLVGDNFYLRYFQKEYDHFEPFFTPELKGALDRIKDIKSRNQVQIASQLLLMYSDRLYGSLDELILTADNPLPFNSYNVEDFKNVIPELKLIFTFLKIQGFEAYWEDNFYPLIEKKIDDTQELFTGWDVEGPIWAILGENNAFENKTIIISYFTKPHGKTKNELIIAQEDLTNKALIQLVIHETLHSFDINSNAGTARALHSLKNDSFIKKRFNKRNPSYNYNTFEGYIEENVVRVLDQIISEHFGIEKSPWKRFVEEDEGMHVLAAGLYFLLKSENYNFEHESFSEFYIRMAVDGKVEPGKFKYYYLRYYLNYMLRKPSFYVVLCVLLFFISMRLVKSRGKLKIKKN